MEPYDALHTDYTAADALNDALVDAGVTHVFFKLRDGLPADYRELGQMRVLRPEKTGNHHQST